MTMPPIPKVAARTGVYRERWWHEMPLYTKDQMRAYGAACAAAERERCAKLVERTGNDHCAAAIRAQD